MQWLRISIITILLISCSIAGTLAVFAYHRRNQTGSKEFFGFIIAIMIYYLGYMLEIASNKLPQMLLSMKIEYLGLSFVPFFWLMLVCQYVGLESRPKLFLRNISLSIAILILIIQGIGKFFPANYRQVNSI